MNQPNTNEKPATAKVIKVPLGGAALIYCHTNTIGLWLFNGLVLGTDMAIFFEGFIIVPDVSEDSVGVYDCFNSTADKILLSSKTVLELGDSKFNLVDTILF